MGNFYDFMIISDCKAYDLLLSTYGKKSKSEAIETKTQINFQLELPRSDNEMDGLIFYRDMVSNFEIAMNEYY